MKNRYTTNTYEYNKLLAIGINATNDINPCQKMEVLTEDGEVVYLDSFKTFFKDPEGAKSKYADIFDYLRFTSEKKDSTKFTVYSHTTNIDDIKTAKACNFSISIVKNKGDDAIRYNLGELLDASEVQKRLEEQGFGDKNIDLGSIGLEGIKSLTDKEGYSSLFNAGIGGGTHNIASSIEAFFKTIKSKWLKIVAPNYGDETKDYTSRTSLFLQVGDTKFCIRTEADPEQLKEVEKVIDENKYFIGDILVTDKSTISIDGAKLHNVPSRFDENVLHNVSTVVFNCEDREMGEVILAVMADAREFLSKNHLDIEIKDYLENGLENLERLKNELNKYNELISITVGKIANSKSDLHRLIAMGNVPKATKAEEGLLSDLQAKYTEYSKTRLNILKEIIIVITELTKITEKKFHKPHIDFDIGRVVLITDGAEGSVGSVESYNHNILFTNTIWDISGDREKKLFRILNRLSKGQIDLDVCDTTGCGDSSTAAAIMIREARGLEIRKSEFIEIFKELGYENKHFSRALAITETYFLSHFQEVISGIVYHCKKSNLGDIPNSEKIDELILGYVFENTKEFIRNGMKKFIYSNNKSDLISRNKYNGFNIYSIKEAFVDLK